jgi:hypothetical protein
VVEEDGLPVVYKFCQVLGSAVFWMGQLIIFNGA